MMLTVQGSRPGPIQYTVPIRAAQRISSGIKATPYLAGLQYPNVVGEVVIQGPDERLRIMPACRFEVHHLSGRVSARISPAGPSYPDRFSRKFVKSLFQFPLNGRFGCLELEARVFSSLVFNQQGQPLRR